MSVGLSRLIVLLIYWALLYSETGRFCFYSLYWLSSQHPLAPANGCCEDSQAFNAPDYIHISNTKKARAIAIFVRLFMAITGLCFTSTQV
jgi:hypothetical protein